MNNFSENLKKLRIERGWSQADLERFSGIPIKTLQNYEQNRCGMQPTVHNLMLLADIFDVSVCSLFYGGDQEMISNSLYMNTLLSELSQLSADQIIAIHDSTANGISLPKLSITDNFISELIRVWKSKFPAQPRSPYRSYVEQVIIRYSQDRQSWKEQFHLK